jgi:lipopolysaccharide export system permease protein
MNKWKLSLIDYYIIRKFLGTFAYALMLIICIAVIFDVAEKLDDFLEKGAPLKAIVVDYYLNFIPYFAVLFSSLFTFISVIFFTSKMAYDTEIIAILNSGMSFRRMMYPYMISAALLSFFQFSLSNFVIPHANKKRFAFEEKYVRNKRVEYNKHHIHKQVEPGLFVYMESFNNSTNTGYKFSIERYEGTVLRSKIMADYIAWDSIKHKWQINQYVKRDINGMTEKMTKGNQLDTALRIDPAEFRQRDNVVEAMNLGELNEYIDVLKLQGAENVNTFIIEREKRMAYPFSTFILTIIGVTLSSRKVRGGIGMHIGIGLGLSFGYILFMQFSSQFAISGSLSPFWAAWIPNIIFAAISVYLYKIAPK